MEPRLLNWLRRLAAERTVDNPHLYDDMVQEAAIAVWSVTERWPDAPREYLIATAKKRMAGVAQGRALTGQPSRQGRRQVTESYEEAPDFGSEAQYSAHEVIAAVKNLTTDDRQICFERYWLDKSWPQMAQERGIPQGRLIQRWTNHIRPQLQGVLA